MQRKVSMASSKDPESQPPADIEETHGNQYIILIFVIPVGLYDI
jgi:hypothetical protein